MSGAWKSRDQPLRVSHAHGSFAGRVFTVLRDQQHLWQSTLSSLSPMSVTPQLPVALRVGSELNRGSQLVAHPTITAGHLPLIILHAQLLASLIRLVSREETFHQLALANITSSPAKMTAHTKKQAAHGREKHLLCTQFCGGRNRAATKSQFCEYSHPSTGKTWAIPFTALISAPQVTPISAQYHRPCLTYDRCNFTPLSAAQNRPPVFGFPSSSADRHCKGK